VPLISERGCLGCKHPYRGGKRNSAPEHLQEIAGDLRSRQNALSAELYPNLGGTAG